MIIHKYMPIGGAVIVATAWSGNTESVVASLCNQVYIKPASADTTFDVTITDSDGVEARKWEGKTGLLNDLTPFPTEGIYTVAISNASKNEAVTVKLVFVEKQGL